MCDSIEQAEIFCDKIINLAGTTLTTSDMECISLLLTSSSNKEWERLNLYYCHIQDKGLNILYRGIRHGSGVTINDLGLDSNGLTRQSSSLISELTVKCKVKKLVIGDNRTIGEDQQFCSLLIEPSNVLEQLYMYSTRLSSSAAIALFTTLKDNNKLKELYIERNAINDDALDAIITALEINSCLVKLSMYGNPLSSEAIINIVKCLEVNNTLQLLGLPHYSKSVQKSIISLKEVVNEKRESRGCLVKLEMEFGYVL